MVHAFCLTRQAQRKWESAQVTAKAPILTRLQRTDAVQLSAQVHGKITPMCA
jgi:hypothetical protein